MRDFYNFRLMFLFIVSFSFFFSCSKEDDPEEEKEDLYFVSVEGKYEYTEASLEQVYPLPGIETVVVNGIKTYKLEYKTEYNNNTITASGTLTLPDTPGFYPLVLVERGTITDNKYAPSESDFPLYEAVAGMGYIVFVPDLIGYGSSEEILHPYYDYEYTATASIDMYYAINEYLGNHSSSDAVTNGKFFISGYSQGGYSGIATYKYISENINDIEVTAVGTGAGGYDLLTVIEEILEEDTYPTPVFLVMPMVTYNQLYINRPLTDIFNEPYAAMIQEVIDGGKEWSQIENDLPNVINELFNNDLIEKLKNEEDTFITQSFIDNSVHDWAPMEPTRLYHYMQDEIVPFETTVSTYEAMVNKGAADVEYVKITENLVPDPSNPHGSAAFGYMILAFSKFRNY